MRQYVLISYDTKTVNLGDNAPGVLYDYLVNEFNNGKIVAQITEYERDPRRAYPNNRMKRKYRT